MTAADHTWIVLIRDISYAVQIDDLPAVVACMVLDAETGLVVGMSAGPDPETACAEALQQAANGDVGPGTGPPSQVVCAADVLGYVRPQVNKVLAADRPAITAATIGPEAEDIFDSLVGHLSGRSQPDEPPMPEDWQELFHQVYEFCAAEPWTRWPDDDTVGLTVTVDGDTEDFVVAVIGQQGLQRGMALYPGTTMPDLDEWQPGDAAPVPPGTLVCHLDPRDETPPDQVGRATRYGWPTSAALAPVLLAVTETGAADLSVRDAHHLTVAAAAVLSHSTEAGGPTGTIPLPNDHEGTFTIR